MGPLAGVRVLELAGMGPAPFCGMVLSDLGAEVVRVERPGATLGMDFALQRGRRSVAIDLKRPKGVETLLSLADRADVLIEGFRPGVAERLGVGPDVCTERNPRLVYGRMTGWGQTGPLARAAGHDINYIALSGILHAIGRKGQPPTPPPAIIGDLGGGGMLLALGVVSALVERAASGRGQVIDAAMVDGAALLSIGFYGATARGQWSAERGTNEVDSGRPYYDVYETADGEYVAVGSLEPQFYAELLNLMGLDAESLPKQDDPLGWDTLRERFSQVFRSRTRSQWCELLEGTDACFAPVLSFADAPQHPHNQQRGTFVTVDGVTQPAPAPRFSRTPGAIRHGAPIPGADTLAALGDWGIDAEAIASLRAAGVIHQAETSVGQPS